MYKFPVQYCTQEQMVANYTFSSKERFFRSRAELFEARLTLTQGLILTPGSIFLFIRSIYGKFSLLFLE